MVIEESAMKYLVFLATIILPLVCFSGCSEKSPTESENHELYGHWAWQNSIGGFSGHDTITPASVGFTKKVQFTQDGVFREFRSDSLYGTSRFTIVSEKTIFSLDSLPVVHFQDSARFPAQVLWRVTRDSLELGDTHVEPYGHYFTRI